VQRTILDVLQEQEWVKSYLLNPTSFGGLKGRGVADAVAAAYKAIADGGEYYVRSDISGFFTKIPRPKVVARLAKQTGDADFNVLLDHATEVELGNLAAIAENADLFPTYELGVAQGCCLSPLMGNLLLHRFDALLNGRGITCLRYIDDFLIIGPSKKSVLAAFANAQAELAKLGMTAYDPSSSPEKADSGESKNGIVFLGVDVRPGLLTPSRKSRRRLIASVTDLLNTSAEAFGSPKKAIRSKLSYARTLIEVALVVKSWGGSYSFSNDLVTLESMDLEINALLGSYRERYVGAMNGLSVADKRRLLGVDLLVDAKVDLAYLRRLNLEIRVPPQGSR
jgi:hypothetical protein